MDNSSHLQHAAAAAAAAVYGCHGNRVLDVPGDGYQGLFFIVLRAARSGPDVSRYR